MGLLRSTPLLLALACANAGACQPPVGPAAGGGAEPPPTGSEQSLAGVDTSELTARERRLWTEQVSELLAPCPELAVSVAQCVRERRDCAACLPAARFLVRQVRAGKSELEIEQLYEARFSPDRVRTIVVGDSASRGPADAPVTVVEWADFECPACQTFSHLLERLEQQFSGRLRLVFKHYPMSYHPHAVIAACAAYAAQQQGEFWRMHRLLYDRSDRLTEPDLIGYAEELDLDVARFKGDMLSEQAREFVDKERRQGEGVGLRATPLLFINGRQVPIGALDNVGRELEEWIRLEIELAGAAKR